MLHVGCERHSSWNGFYTDPYLQRGKGDRHTLMAVFQGLWVPGELLLLPGSSAHVGTCRAGPCVGAQGCTVSHAAGLQEQEIGSWNSEQHQSTPFFPFIWYAAAITSHMWILLSPPLSLSAQGAIHLSFTDTWLHLKGKKKKPIKKALLCHEYMKYMTLYYKVMEVSHVKFEQVSMELLEMGHLFSTETWTISKLSSHLGK